MSAFKTWLNGLTSKSTPVDADELYVRDSSGTPGSKKLTWANLKATLLAYFDTAYLKLTGGTLAGGTVTASTPVLTTTQTWNNAAVAFAGKVTNITDTASASGSLIEDWKVGGTTKFSISKTGGISSYTDAIHNFTLSSFDSKAVLSAARNVELAAGAGWAVMLSGTGGILMTSGGGNTCLYTGAENTLEQRYGTNAQTSRLYNTYTDASNYERGFIRWASNVLEIGAEAGGTGTARGMRFTSPLTGSGYGWTFHSPNSIGNRILFQGSDRSSVLTFSSNEFGSLGGLFSFMDYAAGAASQHALKHTSGNQAITYFGLDGAASGVMQVNNAKGRGNGYGAAVELWEMTAPAAPSTNGVRIYAEDNGSGKTRLMALFATGAAVQIAIEP